jgi:hypothetical protein
MPLLLWSVHKMVDYFVKQCTLCFVLAYFTCQTYGLPEFLGKIVRGKEIVSKNDFKAEKMRNRTLRGGRAFSRTGHTQEKKWRKAETSIKVACLNQESIS